MNLFKTAKRFYKDSISMKSFCTIKVTKNKFEVTHFINHLKTRNSLFQTTTEKFQYNINDRVYIGFDPTSDKLHIGNMYGIINAFRAIAFGFKPIFLIGGATALIGDPSGKNKDREQLSKEVVNKNSLNIKNNLSSIISKLSNSQQFLNFLKENSISDDILHHFDFNSIEIINNADTYSDMTVLNFMRDIVSHFRVASLLSKESAKTRLNSADGMSVIEFMYPIFQGYDYYNLYLNKSVKMQLGGSDQWGNMISGIELINKMHNIDGNKNSLKEDLVMNTTFPLITTKSGKKLGKSEGNSINVCESSSESMFQYLLNQSDDDVEDFLYKITFLSTDEIKEIMENHNKEKEKRIAQRKLAESFLSYYCDEIKIKECIFLSNNFFCNDLSLEYFENSAKIELNFSEFNQVSILQFCINNKLAHRKSELKTLITQEKLLLNNEPVKLDKKLSENDLLFGKYFVIKLSKIKKYIFNINK